METEHYTRIIDGPSDEVYKISTRVASRIGLNLERQFNKEWNKTLVQLLNKPTKNKSMLNLGVYKKDGYKILSQKCLNITDDEYSKVCNQWSDGIFKIFNSFPRFDWEK